MKVWLFRGSPCNVAKSILYYFTQGSFVWGLHKGYKDDYDDLAEGDKVYIYATDPVKAVVVRGIVTKKREEHTDFWPKDSRFQDKWPYRFIIEVDWCDIPRDKIDLLEQCANNCKDNSVCADLRNYGIRLENIKQKVQREIWKRVFGWGAVIELSSQELQQVVEVIDSLISERSGAGEGREYVSDRLLAPSVEFERYLNFGGREDAVLYIYGRVLMGLARRGVAPVEKPVVESVVEGVLKEHGMVDKLGQRLSQVKDFVCDDFRRFGVLTVGGGGNWRGDVAASLTDLGMHVFSFVDRLGRVEGFDERDLAVFVGSLPMVLCLSRGCNWCSEDEAGVCMKLPRNGVRDGATLRLVARAVEVVRSFWRLFLVYIPYGVDVRALTGYGGGSSPQ